MLIMQKIEELTIRYDDSRKTVGEFLLHERRNLKHYTMQAIADQTYTSKSTLVRIAKNLGFSGWTEFMKAYTKETTYLDHHLSTADVNIPFQKNDTYQQIAGEITAVKKSSLTETLELLSEKKLLAAVNLLKNAKRICVFGISVNQYLGELFQHKMLLIGKPVEIVTQAEMKFLSSTMTPEDLAIIISYSGNDVNRMPTTNISMLKERQVPILGITSLGTNLLRESSTCTLSIASRERLYSKIASFATESSIALLLDILYSCYFQIDYDSNMQHKLKVSRKVEQQRFSTASGIMEQQSES